MTGSGPQFDSARWREFLRRYLHVVESLQRGEPDDVGEAIWYLEKRPRFHGSGYLTERALQYIDRAPLTPRQRAAIIAAAEGIVAEGRTRESGKALNLLVRLGVSGAAEARANARRALVRYRGY